MTYRETLRKAREEAEAAARHAEQEQTVESWEAYRKADDNLRGWEDAFDPS